MQVQSSKKMLQNETNPSSVAVPMWKWQPDEEQGVMDNEKLNPAYNIISPIYEHTDFDPRKYFSSYLHVGNIENFKLEHNFDQSLEMRRSGVQL